MFNKWGDSFRVSYVRRYEERYKNTDFLSLIVIFGQKCFTKSSFFIEMFNKSVAQVFSKALIFSNYYQKSYLLT